MPAGAHGDLFEIRYLKVDTPVNFRETNEPLQDLDANIQILDGKLARIMAEGIATTGGGPGAGPAATTGTRTVVIEQFEDAITPLSPSPGTLGTDIDTLDFANGVNENQKFEFTLPENYDSGSLQIFVQYAVNGTSGGTVDFDVTGEIAVSGSITALTPSTETLAVVTTASAPDQLLFLTIPESSVGDGARIRVEFERQGTTDSNSDTFQLISMTVQYTGTTSAAGTTTFVPGFTQDTDEPAPTAGTVGTDIDTLDHPAASDAEQKFAVVVPEEWDTTSDPFIKITYAMSTAVGGSIVRVGIEGEVADVGSGSITALTPNTTDVATPSTTDVTRTVSITQPAASFSKGSVAVFKVARRNTGVPGNHTGDWRVLAYEVVFGVPASASGGGGAGANEEYLASFVFGNESSPLTITADADYPDFSADFETLYSMASTAASGRVDVAFQGRIPQGFTQIDEINLNIKGSGPGPDYVLKVFADGSGATPVYDPTSGIPIAAPGTLSLLTVSGASLSAQPVGQKRFFVVVEAHIDASETIFAGRPYVRYS